MSEWPSTRARRVLAALLRIGWVIKRQTGSHKVLARQGWRDGSISRISTRGVELVNLQPGDRLIAAARVVESDEAGEAGEEIPEV